MRQKGKFRGWNEKNQKWIYGYYFVNRGLHFIVEDGIADPLASWEDFVVVPESVGEYSGLKFESGSNEVCEIYEGDILRCKGLTQRTLGKVDNFIVFFDNGGFFVKFAKYFNDKTCTSKYPLSWAEMESEVEIIGNSYQNPELLTNKSE